MEEARLNDEKRDAVLSSFANMITAFESQIRNGAYISFAQNLVNTATTLEKLNNPRLYNAMTFSQKMSVVNKLIRFNNALSLTTLFVEKRFFNELLNDFVHHVLTDHGNEMSNDELEHLRLQISNV